MGSISSHNKIIIMTNQEIREDYEKKHLETIREMILKTQVGPFIHIIAKEKGEEKPVIMHIDVPADDDMQKELFARHGLPALKEDLKKSDMEIIFITFTTESWLRKTDADKGIPENWKEIPPDECLCIFYSSADEQSLQLYDIVREEFEVDEHGNLIEKTYEVEINGTMYKKVEMKYNEELSKNGGAFGGTFSNLYKQLT